MALQTLIPHDDKNAGQLRAYFFALASLIGGKFLGISLHKDSINLTQSFISQPLLSEWFLIYKKHRQLIHKDYVVSVFLVSTCQLTPLNPIKPTADWQWVAKLCHLLLYFAHRNLTRRITETATECRKLMDETLVHYELWRLFCDELQADTLAHTFARFDDKRKTFIKTNSPLLSKFQSLYRTIEFAHKERTNITRRTTTRTKLQKTSNITIKTTDSDDDNDVIEEVYCYEEDKTTIAKTIDIKVARLDDSLPNFTLLTQSTLAETEKYSSIQIYNRTKAKYVHANKNEIFIISNPRDLPLFVAQTIFDKLWQYCLNLENKYNDSFVYASAYLLLCLYTGRSLNELLVDIIENKKQLVELSNKTNTAYFIIQLNITPLKLNTKGIHSVLANDLTPLLIPLPNHLSTILIEKAPLNNDEVLTLIHSLKQTLNLPYLSLNRLEKTLYSTLMRHITSSQIATIITGRNNKKRADIWYSSNSKQKIYDDYRQAIYLLASNQNTRQQQVSTEHLKLENKKLDTNTHLGSQSTPSYKLTERLLYYLHKKAVQQTDFIAKFNAYNVWLWHIFLLLTSVRAVEGAPGFLNQFNTDIGLGWIQDKEEHAGVNAQRLVPICAFLKIAVLRFVDYLKNFRTKHQKINPNIYQEIQDILNSNRPLLNVYHNDKLISLSAKIIMNELNTHFKFKADWTRHLGQKFLHEEGVSEALILAIFGHEPAGQESHQKYSSLSMGDIIAVGEIYQKLADKLLLEQV